MSKEKMYTAFEANEGLYHYTRVTFSLTNFVPAFQRVINIVISDYNLTGTFAYLDF